MALSIVFWWAVVQLLGLAGLPLTRFVFRWLPDGGYPFAKSLGLLVTGYLAWLIAMIVGAPWGVALLIAAGLAVAVVGWLASRGQTLPPLSLRRVLAYEAVFLAAFAFLLFLRGRYGVDGSNYISPNPWFTERPMDFAFFNAIRRSDSFPPNDPWLAGYSINYYYFGYMLMSMLAMLTGTTPGLAYNLSLATIYALAVLAVVGISTSLLLLTRRPFRPLVGAGVAALAVVLVLFAGNQGGALQNITGVENVLGLSGRDLGRAIVNGLGPRQTMPLQDPYIPWGGELRTEVTPQPVADAERTFGWWWNPSRGTWDSSRDPSDPTKYYNITEFPMFSFLLGDMHPHVMALPFVLLAFALALHTAVRAEPLRFGERWRGWLELVCIGIMIGSLYAINSWDFPTYLLLMGGALALLAARLASGQIDWWPLARQFGLVAVAAIVLLLPFHLTVRSPVGGEPLTSIPLLSGLSRALGLATWTKTPLHSFLIIFGAALVPCVALLLRQRTSAEWRWLPWATLAAGVGGLLLGFPLLFLLPLAIWALLAALARTDDPPLAFVLGALALILAICFGTEVVYLREAFSSRMNTIFKFYYQVWVIAGVLAPFALWRLFAPAEDDAPDSRVVRAGRLATSAVFGVLLAGALVYPLVMLRQTLAQPFATLDGKVLLQNTPAGDAAIAWLRTRTPDGAVIAEAPQDGSYSFDGLAGVSTSTGLPAVVGWTGHQRQWRAGDADTLGQVQARYNDIVALYSTPSIDEARTLISRYGIRYVYVGVLERRTYPPEGIAKFDQLGPPVFQQDDVAIYQVQ